MAGKMYRVFFELDFPEGMLDDESVNPQPIKPTTLLDRIIATGASAEGYTVEVWDHRNDLGFKLVEVL